MSKELEQAELLFKQFKHKEAYPCLKSWLMREEQGLCISWAFTAVCIWE